MGVKVDFAQVVKDLPLAMKQEVFPNYNNNDEQFIKVNESGVCGKSVEIIYDTNFAVIAAETSKIKEIAALAGSIIEDRNIVVNKKNVLATTDDLVDLVFEDKLQSGLQEFKFDVVPCSTGELDEKVKQCFRVALDISYVTVVTNFEDKTDDELAELMAELNVEAGKPVTGYVKDKKKRKGLTSGVLSLRTDPFPMDRKFEVRGQLIENAITDGELGEDSVSGVRINNVKFTIFSVPCPVSLLEDAQSANQQFQQDDLNDGPGKSIGNGTQPKVGKFDLKNVEDIGGKTAEKLKQKGIKDLKALAKVDTTAVIIEGVSPSRLAEFKTMASLITQFPDDIDGNRAELLTRGLGLSDASKLNELAEKTNLNQLKNGAMDIKLPENFDFNSFLNFLKSIQ